MELFAESAHLLVAGNRLLGIGDFVRQNFNILVHVSSMVFYSYRIHRHIETFRKCISVNVMHQIAQEALS